MYYHRDTNASIHELKVCASFDDVIAYAESKADGNPLQIAKLGDLPDLPDHQIKIINYDDLAPEGIELPDNTICEIIWPFDGREPGYNAGSVAVLPLA